MMCMVLSATAAANTITTTATVPCLFVVQHEAAAARRRSGLGLVWRAEAPAGGTAAQSDGDVRCPSQCRRLWEVTVLSCQQAERIDFQQLARCVNSMPSLLVV